MRSTPPSLPCLPLLAALLAPFTAACPAPPPADAGDVVGTDATDGAQPDAPPADAPPADAPPADAPPGPRCGDMRPDVSGITGTEGLIIGPDGTIYFSQPGGVGRMLPDGTSEPTWVSVGAAGSTIWGLALDPASNRLYVGSPNARAIFAVDTSAATPTATPLLSNAGAPNGLTMGPDGALYYSDFSGSHVYRVDVSTMMRTRVTTTTIPSANGVAFASDGSLYVASYMTGSLVRLTLTAGMESARATVAMGLGAPDGVALDAMGRIYVTDNSRGRLVRLDADGTNPMVLGTSIPAAASIEFGAGVLRCTDLYVASSGAVFRYEMGDTPGADVRWHR